MSHHTEASPPPTAANRGSHSYLRHLKLTLKLCSSSKVAWFEMRSCHVLATRKRLVGVENLRRTDRPLRLSALLWTRFFPSFFVKICIDDATVLYECISTYLLVLLKTLLFVWRYCYKFKLSALGYTQLQTKSQWYICFCSFWFWQYQKYNPDSLYYGHPVNFIIMSLPY